MYYEIDTYLETRSDAELNDLFNDINLYVKNKVISEMLQSLLKEFCNNDKNNIEILIIEILVEITKRYFKKETKYENY